MQEKEQNKENKENKLKRFFKRVFQSAIVKGVVKSFPFGGVIYEIADEVKNQKNEENKKASNWFSITVTVLCLVGIIYAFITKQITIENMIELLKSITLQ